MSPTGHLLLGGAAEAGFCHPQQQEVVRGPRLAHGTARCSCGADLNKTAGWTLVMLNCVALSCGLVVWGRKMGDVQIAPGRGGN